MAAQLNRHINESKHTLILEVFDLCSPDTHYCKYLQLDFVAVAYGSLQIGMVAERILILWILSHSRLCEAIYRQSLEKDEDEICVRSTVVCFLLRALVFTKTKLCPICCCLVSGEGVLLRCFQRQNSVRFTA